MSPSVPDGSGRFKDREGRSAPGTSREASAGAVGTSRGERDDKPVSTTHEMADLAAEFGGWHIWRGRSASGRETDWHATSKRRKGGRRIRLAAATPRPSARSWPSTRR